MTDDLIAVPGLSTLGTRERERLVEIADRNGWRPDWLAAAIAHESGWQPDAVNPTSSATGIFQWTKATAKALGTSTKKLRRMSVYDQLPFVESYFRAAAGGKAVDDRDLLVYGLGAAACPKLEDACVLYAAGSAGAKANPGYQDADGNITVRRIRDELASYVAKYEATRLPVKTDREWASTGSPTLGRSTGLGAAALLSLAGVGFVWGTVRGAGRRRRR